MTQGDGLVPTTPLKPKEGLNGAPRSLAVSFLPQFACGKLAAPNDTEGMAWSATTPLKPKEGLNGAPNPWRCHFSLYLPQASRLLGMTKGRVALPFGAVAVMTTSQTLFISPSTFLRQVEGEMTR
jgi:hypothetical protein